jgi:dGTPase
VLLKCNEALDTSNYPLIEDATELIQAVAEIFKGLLEGSVVPSSSDTEEPDVQLWARNRMLNENGVVRTRFTAERVGELIDAVEFVYNKKHPQLSSVRLTRDGLVKVEVLKHLNYELVIRSSRLSVVEHRGRDLVNNIFQAISKSGGLLLPGDWRERYDLVKSNKAEAARLVCDYVSGMTDTYAVEVYDRLFGKGASMFKPL